MRGPRDSIIESTTKTTERGVSTEGGKVLQRLLLFEEERGFPEEPIGEIPPRRSRRAIRAGTRARGAARAELTDQEIAATYAEAAQALQAGQPMEATAKALPEGGAERAAAPPTWRWLGPTYMPNGQTYGDTRVDVSGRVSSIAIDLNNRNHILCGSAAGGVWESRNGGASLGAAHRQHAHAHRRRGGLRSI